MSAIKTAIINAIGDAYESMPIREVMRGSDAIIAALEAAGYAVVPVEPTLEMIAAWDRVARPGLHAFEARYKAMLTAAKETP